MKKLMIAACTAVCAVAVHAAAFTWETDMMEEVMLPETETFVPSATAYIFASSTTGSGATTLQSVLVDAFAAGTLDLATAGNLGSASLVDGAIATTGFNYGAKGDNTDFYFALIAQDGEGNDMLYIAPEVPGSGYDSQTEPLYFVNWEASTAPAMDATAGYNGAGWYTAVPEPTSGLLLLLGVAGLALRRRRA